MSEQRDIVDHIETLEKGSNSKIHSELHLTEDQSIEELNRAYTLASESDKKTLDSDLNFQYSRTELLKNGEVQHKFLDETKTESYAIKASPEFTKEARKGLDLDNNPADAVTLYPAKKMPEDWAIHEVQNNTPDLEKLNKTQLASFIKTIEDMGTDKFNSDFWKRNENNLPKPEKWEEFDGKRNSAEIHAISRHANYEKLVELEKNEKKMSNTIENVPELEKVDRSETLVRAALQRKQDKESLFRDQNIMGDKAESKRINVENLSQKVVEQNNKNLTAESTGSKTEYSSQVETEREKSRQIRLMEGINKQFRQSGEKYHFKDRNEKQKLAFKDKGSKVISGSNDERVSKAMTTMAEAKGWKTIKVSGHPDFKRDVWKEASLKGIEVRGFKPNEQDLKDLEKLREKSMKNEILKSDSLERNNTGDKEKDVKHSDSLKTTPKDIKKSDQHKVVEAVASALIHSKVKNPEMQKALQTAINAKLNDRAKEGNIPSVQVYDKNAHSKAVQQDRTSPVVEQNAERVR